MAKTISIEKAKATGNWEAIGLTLTGRQRAFCHEYVHDFDQTAAAIRAGYAVKWADRQAHLLMRHDRIRMYIDHLTVSKEAKITAVSPDYVVQRVLEIIESEATDGNKLRGLELLARHLGMLRDKTEISGPDGGPIETQVKEDVQSFNQMIKNLKRNQKAQEDGSKSSDDSIVDVELV